MARRGEPVARTYTPEIIATPCRTCGKQPPERCRPVGGGAMLARYSYPPHATRVADSQKETKE